MISNCFFDVLICLQIYLVREKLDTNLTSVCMGFLKMRLFWFKKYIFQKCLFILNKFSQELWFNFLSNQLTFLNCSIFQVARQSRLVSHWCSNRVKWRQVVCGNIPGRVRTTQISSGWITINTIINNFVFSKVLFRKHSM